MSIWQSVNTTISFPYCSTEKDSIHSSQSSGCHSQQTSLHQDSDNLHFKKPPYFQPGPTDRSQEILKKLSGLHGVNLQYDKLQAVADLAQFQTSMQSPVGAGGTQWGQQQGMRQYNAKTYQDLSATNKSVDNLARKLESDFTSIPNSRDASPASTASSSRPIHVDMDYTLASKDGLDSSCSSGPDERRHMYRRLASDDLDVSLEHERKGLRKMSHKTDMESPRSDEYNPRHKDKHLAYKLSKSTPDLQKLSIHDNGSYTGPTPSVGGYGDNCSVTTVKTNKPSHYTGVGHQQAATSLSKSNPSLVSMAAASKSKENKTSKAPGSPLCALRLRPIRQKTRNAVVNILDSGEVCLEFIKSKDGRDQVMEVFRISPDGHKVRNVCNFVYVNTSDFEGILGS